MQNENLRNIAIIAHVDHGKTSPPGLATRGGPPVYD